MRGDRRIERISSMRSAADSDSLGPCERSVNASPTYALFSELFFYFIYFFLPSPACLRLSLMRSDALRRPSFVLYAADALRSAPRGGGGTSSSLGAAGLPHAFFFAIRLLMKDKLNAARCEMQTHQKPKIVRGALPRQMD